MRFSRSRILIYFLLFMYNLIYCTHLPVPVPFLLTCFAVERNYTSWAECFVVYFFLNSLLLTLFSGGVEDDVEYAEESEDTREGDEEQGEVKEEEEEDEEEEESKEIDDISSLLKEDASGEKNGIKTENLGKRKSELIVSEEPAKKKNKKKQKKTKDMEKCKVVKKRKILFIPVLYSVADSRLF